jgi:hypothetical protein
MARPKKNSTARARPSDLFSRRPAVYVAGGGQQEPTERVVGQRGWRSCVRPCAPPTPSPGTAVYVGASPQ